MKIIFFCFLVFLDFITKQAAFNLINLNQIISIAPFVDLTHVHNYGISFGLFAGLLPMWLIVLLGVIVVILLIFWVIKTSNKIEKWAILLIIAGAISNIGDRLINNYVLDFILLSYKQFYWPAFNFADIYISVGVLMIIMQNIRIFNNRLNKKND